MCIKYSPSLTASQYRSQAGCHELLGGQVQLLQSKTDPIPLLEKGYKVLQLRMYLDGI